MKSINNFFGEYKLIEEGNFFKIMMVTICIMITSCSSSHYILKTNLPPSGGNYVFHTKNSSFPLVTNATVSNDTISGKVNFRNRIVNSDLKYHVYVYNDSLIKVNSDVITVPLENASKISLEIPPYSVLKKEYNPRTYSFKPGDPYNPTSAGLASLIICGLGQGVIGDGGRGLLFFTGYAGCMYGALAKFIKYSSSHEGEDVRSLKSSGTLFLSAIVIDIWSAINAEKAAKTKNLFFRKNYSTDNLNNKPHLNTNEHYETVDPYNPGVTGLASLIIPGFGQILAGEPTRGLLFLSGFVGLKVIKYRTMRSVMTSESNQGTLNAITYLLYGYHIWSMFDAYLVARRNNMAFRDKHNVTYSFKLQPYFGSMEYFTLTGKIPLGASFLINF